MSEITLIMAFQNLFINVDSMKSVRNRIDFNNVDLNLLDIFGVLCEEGVAKYELYIVSPVALLSMFP